MANYFEQFEPDEPDDEQQEPDEPRTEEGGGNFFAQFDQRQAPPPRAGEGNFFAQFHQQQDQPEPEAEGMLATFARKARDAVLPTLGGISGGALAAGAAAGAGRVLGGAAGGFLGGPGGAVAGWLGGGLAGGYLGEKVYSAGKELLGYDDSIQQAVNAKTNPWSSAAGEVAPLALGLTPTTAAPRIGAKFLESPIGQRLLSGAVSGGAEAGMQVAQGEYDPTRLVTSLAAGAALPGNRGWVSGLEQRGEALAGRIAPHGTPGAKAAAGTAEEQAPPPPDPARQQPGADERYAKEEPTAQVPPDEEAATPATPPEAPRVSDPTLDAALQAKLKPEAPEAPEAPIAPEPAPEPAPDAIPGPEAQARPLPTEPPEVVAPVKNRGPRGRDPGTYSLLEYLASRGGLRPSPELQTIFDGNPFIPGFGRLIRKNGKSLDSAWEAATRDASYINDASDRAGREAKTGTSDLLRLIEEEARGTKQYQIGYEGTTTRAQRDRAAESNRIAIERAVDGFVEESGLNEIDPKLHARTIQIMEREGVSDPDIAYERAVMEDADRHEQAARKRERQDTVGDIPGWDAHDVGAAREDGGGLRETRPGQPSPGAVAAEPGALPRGAGASGTEERGAEGKPQLVIPGAGRISEGQLAQRRANERLRPSAPQRPMDEGIFGDTHLQGDLLAGRPPAKPTVGEQLKAQERARQQPTREPQPAAPEPPAKFSIAKDTDTGRHVLFRNGEEVGDFANRGAAEQARTKAVRLERIRETAARANQIAEEPDQAIRRQEIVRGRSGRPIETAPLPIGTEQAILERGAAKVAAGRTPDEPVPPLRQAQVRQGPEEGGQPPKPPTVGEAAAAAGGTPPPGPTSMAYVPPQKRSNLSNLWRSMKLLVGSDIGPHGREAEHIIRGSEGKAKRVFEQTINLLNPHQEMVLPMNAADRAAMMNRIEGGDHFPDWKPTPEQQRLIDDHKPAMDLWKTEFSKLDRTAQMKFVDDYAAHMYKNPAQAAEFFNNFGRGRGGAGSTKKRTYATYEDAKAAGLEPLTDNPVEIATRYGLSMTNFIAANDALERGVETGVIGYFRPGKSVGATGSPEPQQIGGPPPGWKKLDAPSKGQGPFHLDAYAPEDFADKYNTFYSRGLRGAHAPIYDALRNSNAAWTQMELGLNAYHFFTMANEAIISDVAKGLNQIFSGQFKEGALSIAKAPLAPRISYIEGKRFQQEYLNPNSTNPIASIMAEANARPIGRGHAYDILGSAGDENISRGSFIKNMSRDKINSELKQAWDDIKQDWGLADTVGKQVLFPFKQASRALQTIGAPLFDKYIPALKAGAVHSQMEAWLQANPRIDINTPDGRRAAVEAAKKITDSTDNRFGEMVHDNLFMNQTLRQSAMVAMRSFSWTVGAMREIAGGTYAAGKAGALSLKNQENRFSMAHPEFDPRISYAIAFPFVMATISAIYQGLRAGEAPQDWRDLYAPRTGGTIPGLGGKGQVKEHALMPGFQKDVYGWLTHPLREGYAKLGGLTTTAIEQITNEDWRGDPITKRGANPLEQIQQRAAHLFSRFGPIGVRSMMKGQPETSGITPVETALGFRAPGVDIQDPVRLENWMKKKTEKEWKAKQQHEKTEQRKYARERVYDPREREQVPQ